MSSGLERTEAYRMRGCNHRRLSNIRSRSTKWGFDMRSISFWFTCKEELSMYILAPAVLVLGLSFALYGTKEVWQLSVYTMQEKNIHPVIAEDIAELQTGVRTGQIRPDQAEMLFQQKHQIPSNVVRTVLSSN